MSDLIKLDTEPTSSVCCSFCAKLLREVHRMIAAPTANICDECVMLSLTIIYKKEAGENQKLRTALKRAHTRFSMCSCGEECLVK